MIDAFKGILTGMLIGILIFYSLRPSIPYPYWMLTPYEHPWMFILLLVLIVYLLMWDQVIGVMFLLVVGALLLDLYLLGTKHIESQHDDTVHYETSEGDLLDVPSFEYPKSYDMSTDQLEDLPIDSGVYPMFDLTDMDLQPGQPSPY